MNKKYLSAILFGTLMTVSTGMFTSCKDYDDDIDNLQEQLDKKASLEETQKSLDELKTNVQAATDEAQAAAEKAQEALDEAKKALEQAGQAGSGVTSEDLQKAVEDAEKKLQAEIDKKASLDDVSKEIGEMETTLKNFMADNYVSEEDLTNLRTDVDELINKALALIGGRLTSISLIPTTHINGIPSIEFTTLTYIPQVYKKIENHQNDAKPENHQNRPVLDHADINGASRFYISTEENTVNYHVSPSMGVKQDDVTMPSFDCIKSVNTTKSVADELITNNNPIEVTDYAINNGVMTVKFRKNKEVWNQFIGTEGEAHGNSNKESFYMASLRTPIAKENWTEEEIKKGEEVVVNSEYSRIEELVKVPYLVNKATDFKKTIGTEFADETQINADGEKIYVHYHDSICLWKSGNEELVDVKQPYNQKLDLRTLVSVCAVPFENVAVTNHDSHILLENYADYGLDIRFYLPKTPYLQGNLKTDEQKFGKILDDGYTLKSEVYDVELGDDEFSKTSIGREPIVRVVLVDTKNNNNLIAQRYIKVRWIGTKDQTIDPITFENKNVSCKDMYQQLFSQDMNEKIYHKIDFDGDNSISKTQFHTIYTQLKINAVRKDGVAVDLSQYPNSVSVNDWDRGTDAIKEDGGEAIKNDKDLLFAMIPDANDNTSYNIVWAMSEDFVGKLAEKNGEYASTFEIDVEYVDPQGLNGNIHQTFIQKIVAPTQKFAYQGTYWKDGKGAGTFNVNPIVFNSTNDSWLNESNPHDYNSCKLADYSHIEADLVNGYIYSDTKQKPANLAQFIQYIRECADVKFVFDADRFNEFDYLSDFVVSADGTELWRNAEGGDLVDTDKAPNNNINVDDANIWDYVQGYEDIAATINNFMGATAAENLKNLPWDYNEKLGSSVDECSAIIRLHESDARNATPAATELIGRDVPVKLVVEYNSHNIIPVQKFYVHFIKPLEISGAFKDAFTDAVIDGSFVNISKNFTFEDWNHYMVSAATPASPSEKEQYAHELYDYYAVNSVIFDTEGTTTSLAYDEATSTYIHKDGEKNGLMPTGRSLKMMKWTESQPKSTAQEVGKDPTHLAYFNNDGTPVNVNYVLYVDVNVKYKWGILTKEKLPINVNKAEGTPSGE